eukprot:8898796-Pyramimonas_sp.AAC.1
MDLPEPAEVLTLLKDMLKQLETEAETDEDWFSSFSRGWRAAIQQLRWYASPGVSRCHFVGRMAMMTNMAQA